MNEMELSFYPLHEKLVVSINDAQTMSFLPCIVYIDIASREAFCIDERRLQSDGRFAINSYTCQLIANGFSFNLKGISLCNQLLQKFIH